MSEWIPVNELPQLKEGFDVDDPTSFYREVCINVIVWDDLEKAAYSASYSDSLGFDNRNPDITHWMYFPEGPNSTPNGS